MSSWFVTPSCGNKVTSTVNHFPSNKQVSFLQHTSIHRSNFFRFHCYIFRKCLATRVLLLSLSKLYSSIIDWIMSESVGALSIHIDFHFVSWKASNWCALAKRRVGITLISFNKFMAKISSPFFVARKFLDEYLCFHVFITPHADTT